MVAIDIVLSGLILGGTYALIALGLTLQYGVARIMNLAYGEGLVGVIADGLPKLAVLNPTWRAYWLAAPAAWIAFLFVARRQSAAARSLALAMLLVADLLMFSIPHPGTRPTDEIYPRSPVVDPIRDDEMMPGALVYDPDVNDAGDCFFGPGSPMASAYGVRTVRGYNPLDVARYRQFLAFVADEAEPQRAFSGNFTNPVMRGFPVRNRSLFDLLGVAWQIAPADDPPAGGGWVRVKDVLDEHPRSYNFLGRGIAELPEMRLYFNTQSMPRAFVVPTAVPEAGEAGVLNQLKRLDFWQTATLADRDPATDPLPKGDAGRRWQQVIFGSPNRLVIELDGKSAGLLVVTDPWYPGWRCWVDGQETKIWKADYAFRGVMVPAGSKEVVFKFEPRSYRRGRIISLGAMVGLVLFGIACLRRR